MMDLARQNIVNREIPARRRSLDSFHPRSGPFSVLWVVSNLLSVALGFLMALWGSAS